MIPDKECVFHRAGGDFKCLDYKGANQQGEKQGDKNGLGILAGSALF